MLSESVWLRLGDGTASCLDQVAEILRAGAFAGDPDYMANVLWAQTLDIMHLARIRVGVRRAGGAPELFPIAPERVVETCVAAALATVGARR